MTQEKPQVKWSEVRVESWNDLLNELHSPKIIPEQKSQGGHRRSPYVFRGMGKASWLLETSIQRLKSPPKKVEFPLLRAFSKYALTDTITWNSEWEKVSVAQHNGLPTRVLDWTVSPLIAAHFATAGDNHKKSDGVIWCVNADIIRDQLLPQTMRQGLYEKQAIIFNTELFAETIPTLADFDKIENEKDILIFFEPPSIDQRIQNQFGILSAMNGSEKSYETFFQKNSISHPELIYRIIIDKKAKAEIRDMLDQNNITERMLFPGLPGLCAWLKRYYGIVKEQEIE